MITSSAIKAYLQAMASAASCSFVREEQTTARPTYPIMSYKIITNVIGSDRSTVRVQVDADDDVNGPRVGIKQSRSARATISLTFRSKESLSQAEAAALLAYKWTMSLAGKAAAKTAGIVPRLINTAIQDRTFLMGSGEFENRVGFDIRVDGRLVHDETVEAAQSVQANLTAEPWPAESIEVSV